MSATSAGDAPAAHVFYRRRGYAMLLPHAIFQFALRHARYDIYAPHQMISHDAR